MIFRIRPLEEYKQGPNLYDLGLAPIRIPQTGTGNPPLVPKLTGKVYLRNKDGELEQLEGVHYSNLNANWYDDKGNPHPLQKKYHGRKWSIRFVMYGNCDKDGNEIVFDSQLLAGLGIGEFGPIDWAGVHDAEQHEIEVALKYKLLSGWDDPYIKYFIRRSATGFVYFTCPFRQLKEVEPFVIYLVFTLLLDEQVDNLALLKRKLPFEQLKVVRDKFVEVLYGERDPEEQEVDFNFPNLKTICRYSLYLRNAFLELCDNREIVDRWLYDMNNYINGVILGNCAEWYVYEKNCKNGSNWRAKYDVRTKDVGVLPTMSAQLCSYRNQLPQKIHDDHLYQFCRKLVADNITYVNDLFSYKKEFRDEENCSMVFAKHNHKGLTLHEALTECVDEADNCVKNIIDLGNLLLKLYNNDKWLQEALYMMKAMVLGHSMWYAYGLSYHNGLTMDCIVHPEDDKYYMTTEEQPKFDGTKRVYEWWNRECP